MKFTIEVPEHLLALHQTLAEALANPASGMSENSRAALKAARDTLQLEIGYHAIAQVVG